MRGRIILYWACVCLAAGTAAATPGVVRRLTDNNRADSTCYEEVSKLAEYDTRLSVFILKRTQDGLLSQRDCREVRNVVAQLHAADEEATENRQLRAPFEGDDS